MPSLQSQTTLRDAAKAAGLVRAYHSKTSRWLLAMIIFTGYLVRGLQLVLGTSKRVMAERAEELGARGEDIPLRHSRHPSEPSVECRQ